MENKKLKWNVPEYVLREKSRDWYWALGIIALSVIIASILYHNFLFAILVLVASFSLYIYASREPSIIDVEIGEKGIIVNNTLYPYVSLDSFWIEDHDSKILVKSKKTFMPLIVIPYSHEIEHNELRNTLVKKLPEVEHHEPASQKLMEHLGF